MHNYDTVDLVLEDSTTTCGATTGSATMIWECVGGFHGNEKHYFVRKV